MARLFILGMHLVFYVHVMDWLKNYRYNFPCIVTPSNKAAPIKTVLNKSAKFFNSWTGTIIIVLLITFFIAQNFMIPTGSMKNSLLIGDRLFAKKFAYGIPTPHIPFLEIPLIAGTDGHLMDGDKPKRGDVVVFRPPHDPKNHFVKRCVALPGDEVIYVNKHLYLRPVEGDPYIREHYPQDALTTIENRLWVKDPYRAAHKGINYSPGPFTSFDMLLQSENAMQLRYFPELDAPTYTGFANQKFNAFYKKIAPDEYFMMGDNRDHSSDSRFWGSVPYGLLEGTPWFIYLSFETRSYSEVFSDDLLGQGSDLSDLYKVCQEVIDANECSQTLYSKACIGELSKKSCEKAWQKHQYAIRWERIGTLPTELQ